MEDGCYFNGFPIAAVYDAICANDDLAYFRILQLGDLSTHSRVRGEEINCNDDSLRDESCVMLRVSCNKVSNGFEVASCFG